MSKDETAIIQIGVRVPERVKNSLEKAAKRRGWSVNKELVDRIDRSFRLRGLLGEVLEQLHGTEVALALMTAHDAGMLNFTEENKRQMKERLVEWVDCLPSKDEKLPPVKQSAAA